MGANDRGIDEQMLHVGLAAQGMGHAFPDPAVAPAREPHIRPVPVPKLHRKITPWAAGAHDPEHRLDEAPVVLGRAARVAGLARQKVFNALPLVVPQHLSIHS